MDTPSFEEYVAQAERTFRRYPGWRKGQAYFNVLYNVRPDLSEQIRATSLDPFYSEAVDPLFLDWVEAHW